MTFQFKITIADVTKPKVYRRVTVPGSFNFHDFHLIIQALFGWKDYHLYQFVIRQAAGTMSIAHPNADLGLDYSDSTKVKLKEVFGNAGEKLTYVYDFGDWWKHLVVLEEVTDAKTSSARFIDGEGACPPEDCGGVSGFDNFKRAVKFPFHKEHKELRNWVGLKEDEEWDEKNIDAEGIERRLEEI